MSIERYGAPKSGGLPFAKAAGADGWLFVSGQVPRDGEGQIVYGNMTTQAKATPPKPKQHLITLLQSSKQQVIVLKMLSESVSGLMTPEILQNLTKSMQNISHPITPLQELPYRL